MRTSGSKAALARILVASVLIDSEVRKPLRRARANFGIDKDTSKFIVASAAFEPEVRIRRFRKLVRTSGSRHERPLNSTRHARDNARNSVKELLKIDGAAMR